MGPSPPTVRGHRDNWAAPSTPQLHSLLSTVLTSLVASVGFVLDPLLKSRAVMRAITRSKTDYYWPDAYSLLVRKAKHKVMATCPLFSFLSLSLPSLLPFNPFLSWPWLSPSRTIQKSRFIAPVHGFLGGTLGLCATASLTETPHASTFPFHQECCIPQTAGHFTCP